MRQLPRLALISALLALAFGPSSAAAKTGLFQTPSGNIGCYLDPNGVRCDIRFHDWTSPPRPSWCDVDYGYGLQVGKKHRATFICAGDTAIDRTSPVLAYDHHRSAGRFTCWSRTAGITCRNRNNGHGFFLSRQSYRRF
jgi:hypothetical protein